MNQLKHLLAAGLIIAATQAKAQPCGAHDAGVINAPVLQQHVPTKKVVSPPSVREADYVWSKRVWRTIDLRQKMNYPLYYPLEKMDCRWSLFHILTTHIEEGTITAYLPYDFDQLESPVDGDQFKYPLVPSRWGENYELYKNQILNEMFVSDPIDIIEDYGPDGFPNYKLDSAGNIEQRVDTTYFPIEAEQVVQYKIKEDWFFEKQRSVLDVRILGIAPVVYQKNEDDQITGMKTLFWVYFPEARYVLQNFYVYNEMNDARRMSFDDLFWKRKFMSYVTKETNVYDRKVAEYTSGVEALLEAEKIDNSLSLFEQDIWHY